MPNFRILFHGQFSKPGPLPTGVDSRDIPYEGFYASRQLIASSSDAAIKRGRELIREELDRTLLRDRQEKLVALDVEEWEVAEEPAQSAPNAGFTFY